MAYGFKITMFYMQKNVNHVKNESIFLFSRCFAPPHYFRWTYISGSLCDVYGNNHFLRLCDVQKTGNIIKNAFFSNCVQAGKGRIVKTKNIFLNLGELPL